MTNYLYNIPLKEVVYSQKGTKPLLLSNKPLNDGIPYLDINALETGEVKEYTNKNLGIIADENDVLVVWDGSRSGLVLKGKKGAIGSTLMSLTPIELDSEYLYYFIKRNFEFINNNTTGSGIPHVDGDLFYNLKIPFLSIANQKKIITNLKLKIKNNGVFLRQQQDEIRKVFTTNKLLVPQNEKINISIARFKGAMFEKAFSGELTEKWRKKNNVSIDSWQTHTLEIISNLITSGSRSWSKYYSKKGARFIRTQDIKENKIDKTNMIFVDLPKDSVEGKRTKVQPGDLLFTIVGSNIGKVAVVDESFDEDGYVNQAIALVKLKEKKYSQFLHLYFQSPQGQAKIKAGIYGDAQPDLTLDAIRNLDFPLPSLREQNEIIKKVNQIVNLTNRIQTKYETATKEIDKLELSILSEAFDKEEIVSEKIEETRDYILNKIANKKEKLVLERKKIYKERAKIKLKMTNEANKKKEILQILKDHPIISVEELWEKSLYNESKDVEAFYIELTRLKSENIISASFLDEKKVFTNISLL